MTTILVIADTERDKDGTTSLVASHGINLATDNVITLPPQHPKELGAHFSLDYGEWVISK